MPKPTWMPFTILGMEPRRVVTWYTNYDDPQITDDLMVPGSLILTHNGRMGVLAHADMARHMRADGSIAYTSGPDERRGEMGATDGPLWSAVTTSQHGRYETLRWIGRSTANANRLPSDPLTESCVLRRDDATPHILSITLTYINAHRSKLMRYVLMERATFQLDQVAQHTINQIFTTARELQPEATP